MRLTRHYCSKCRKDNVKHSYEECPTWRLCGYCDQEGHWGFHCPTPHYKCLRGRCGVHVGHCNIGEVCPVSRETKVQNFGYACNGQVTNLEHARNIYRDGMDWSSYG